MKTKQVAALLLMIIALVSFASCDMITEFIDSRTRPIPLIQTYNANLENTRRMVPNDILHVHVQGLEPETEYIVTVYDPEGIPITQMIALSDEEGAIKPSPLWYDIGFETDDDGKMVLSEANLTVSAFQINVKDEADKTNFSLPFWFVSSNDNYERPQPIIYAGKRLTDDSFSMENAFYSDATDLDNDVDYPAGTSESEKLTDTLYFRVENMTPLITPVNESDDNDPAFIQKVKLWVLPFTGDGFSEGDQLSEIAYFSMDLTVGEIMEMGENGILLQWPQNYPVSTVSIEEEDLEIQDQIPVWAENMSFSLFLDMKDRGIEGFYNIEKEGFDSFYLDAIDGNGVAGFVVKEKPPVTTPDYISIQLASGGIFRGKYVYNTTYNYWRYEYTYDYRDEFKYNAYDTKYSSHSGPFWGYGVKVIWNPYSTPAGWTAEGVELGDIPSRFWGRVVNVYIVEVDENGDPINGPNDTLKPAEGTIMNRVPVQYGCSNGWWQQTIWRTPMSSAYADKNYMIVVDMDNDGKLSDNDLVDDVRNDGETTKGGFSIVTNY